MIPKRKAVTDVPANLAVFDPQQWDSVLDWVVARRAHLGPVAVNHVEAIGPGGHLHGELAPSHALVMGGVRLSRWMR